MSSMLYQSWESSCLNSHFCDSEADLDFLGSHVRGRSLLGLKDLSWPINTYIIHTQGDICVFDILELRMPTKSHKEIRMQV